ncbi:hypothetical protein GQX74_004223 [Glossina fuscipes]|nr:hypothetical protein GQX74_004223 [Glossina fuscipes]
MSQHRSIVDNSKEYIFVKLTDSAFRAIEEYQRNLQSKRLGQGQCAKIQFIGNAGVIHFPTADGGGGPPDGRKFGFAIDDVEGSLECIQQTGAELDVLGALNYRMRIHANDDVYDTTRTKMAIAEETEKRSAVNSRSSPNPITMGGSGTTGSNNRYGSPSNLSSSSSTSCLPSLMTSASSLSSTLAGGITTGYQSASCRNSPPPMVVASLQKNSKGGGGNGSGRGSLLGVKSSSSKGSGSSSGNNSKLPDVSRRKIRERLIHLLALKPFKKPELYARLQNEGLAQRERQLITNILKDISTLSRDNTYNLRRSLWNDVDENWPYFTEQELQQLKRRKPQNLTPPMSSDAGSSTSGQSPTSSTHTGSPPPLVAGGTVVGCGLKRASLEPDLYDGALLSGVQPKKQRISHYKKDMLGGGGLTASTSAVRVPGNTYQHQSRNSLAYSPPSYNSGGSNGSISNQVQTNDENSGNSDLTFNVLNNVDDLMAHASIGYGGVGGDQQQSIQTRSNGSSKTSLNNKFAPTTKSITSGSLKEKRGSACNSSREITTATGIRRSNNSPTPYANNFVPESKSNSSDGNSRPHVSQQLLHHNLHKSTSSNSVFGHNNSQHEETVNNRSRHHSSGRDSSKHSKSTSALQGQSPQKQCSNNNSNKYQQNNYQQQQQQQQSMMLSYTNQHLVDTPPQAQCTILNTPFVTYRQPQHSSPTQQQIDAAADSFSMTTNSTTDASRYDFSNYTPITSIEQRRQYKTEFESDYDEYRKLLGQVDSVAQRFREMAESLKKVRQGCQDYYKIKNQILNEYHRVRNEEAINRDKQRFDYLHEKLAHIKQLVMDYDKKLTSGAIPPPSHPSQSQKMMVAAQHVVAANPSQQVANVPAPAPISTQIPTGDTVPTRHA